MYINWMISRDTPIKKDTKVNTPKNVGSLFAVVQKEINQEHFTEELTKILD